MSERRIVPESQARVSRQELPGRRWYFASCQNCRWLGLDWKDKAQAKLDRDSHNSKHHSPAAPQR